MIEPVYTYPLAERLSRSRNGDGIPFVSFWDLLARPSRPFGALRPAHFFFGRFKDEDFRNKMSRLRGHNLQQSKTRLAPMLVWKNLCRWGLRLYESWVG